MAFLQALRASMRILTGGFRTMYFRMSLDASGEMIIRNGVALGFIE
ncbi:MAG: hypothetical protein A4E38_01112 [Methanoregulaceae archaeon PtaB.Bin108]|nr:MAG: hypothetical protein A4E38_01112 [Methanoregulaceae archaeon PtaB.Bin108]